MSLVGEVFDVDYARTYGQQDFTTVRGDVVSVVSGPTWEDFYKSLATATHLGAFVLSPELITSPGDFKTIPPKQAEIEERIDAVRELSGRRPDTTIALGTATFSDDPDGRPANSLVFIAGGEVVAQTNKSFSHRIDEEWLFTFQQVPIGAAIDRRLTGILCSELLDPPDGGQKLASKVTPDTETLLVSSYWAVPYAADVGALRGGQEDRFRRQLEGRIGVQFRRNPNLREVIIADRLPEDSEKSSGEGPYSGHFKRLPD